MGIEKDRSRERSGFFPKNGASDGPRQMGDTGDKSWKVDMAGELESDVETSVKTGDAASDKTVLLALLLVRTFGGGRASR